MKPVIAFVTGGISSESVLSYKSATVIEKNLDYDKYNIYKIDVTPGEWFYNEGSAKKAVDKNDFSIKVGGKKVRFDAVFMGIHGSPGDGKLQGYLDLMNIPYTTSDAVSSALTSSKRYTVAVAGFAGIHVAKSIHVFNHTPITPESIAEQLQFPVFVKPNKCGASIGMSKVNQLEELEASLAKAFKEDDQILVEEFIAGREFTIGVFASRGEIMTLPLTEIKTSQEFYDFETKCTTGLAEEITPAQVEEAVADKIRAAAKKLYQVFNMHGIVRIDFIYNDAKDAAYMLEINNAPGHSEFSIIPQQIRALGWSLKKFYTLLIEDALTRKKLA